MQYSYYVGEGREAQTLIAEAKEKETLFAKAARELVCSFPNACAGVHRGDRGPLIGIAFAIESQLDDAQCRELGLKIKYEIINNLLAYFPNMRSNKGKELNSRIQALNRLHTTVSAYIINKLNVDRWLFDGRCMFKLSVGIKDGKIFVRIPGAPNDKERAAFPTFPAWFRAPATADELAFMVR